METKIGEFRSVEYQRGYSRGYEEGVEETREELGYEEEEE